ncbi:DUF2254 domain-containing protein [Sphingorhabdus sp. SMR4y]|uniref:DUF2254 domain-containing protein n=1 Tax=Sphingorhabdus sp. SMR4y TaxID=2584094 RepID=UPI000B5CEC72|nr:DUF2254 domain-containing protein [Sphingorhabdus sp. SMR4y]ASK89591.1 hypothetical protein SPHFLASMR4Y_02856 [Sphingorhabdus sp. SMR4y]
MLLVLKKYISRLPEKIWFRAMLFSIGAIAAAVAAELVGPLIPYEADLEIASGSVGDILTILASSMLAVIAFSVSIMVSAYGSATSTATPRTIALMLADDRSQNALSTFLGTFLFSIVGIIGLSAGYYDDKGRIILFFATIAVIVIISGTLINWIQQLSTFGRMNDLIERVERATSKALRWHGQHPHLNARPPVAIPEDALPVRCDIASGVVTSIDMGQLQEAATEHDVTVHLAIHPGKLIYPARPLLYLSGGSVKEADLQAFRDSILVEHDRSFDQDPRFGLVVLSEIASRALSPAVNDPGTAISVLDSGLRCFEVLAEASAEPEDAKYASIHGPEIEVEDLFTDFFIKIARDGSGMVEVQQRIQLCLLALAQSWPDQFSAAAAEASRDALARALDTIVHKPDIEDLKARSKKVAAGSNG